jgi:hypothetical protein
VQENEAKQHLYCCFLFIVMGECRFRTNITWIGYRIRIATSASDPLYADPVKLFIATYINLDDSGPCSDPEAEDEIHLEEHTEPPVCVCNHCR